MKSPLAVASSLLLVALWPVASCSSTPLAEPDQAAAESGAGSGAGPSKNGGSGGEGAASLSDAGAPDGGTPAEPAADCLGSAGSPTDGKACGCNRDCDFGQACLPESSGFPGGLCVQICADKADCQPGFECVELVPGDSKTRDCFQSCATSADCRRGYVCGPFAAVNPADVAAHLPSGNFCQPFCQGEEDCPATGSCNRYNGTCGSEGPARSDIGDPCTRAADCTQLCFTGTPGGYCSALCSLEHPGCPAGSACVVTLKDAGDFGACLLECATDDDCRPSYHCLDDPSGATICR